MSWLIPSECFRYVRAPRALISVSVKSSIASMSLTWNGKATRPQTWQRAFEKGGWTRLLFSLMYNASTQSSLVDAWTRYWRVSHVPQSLSPANEKGSKTSDGFGPTSGEWLARREHGCWAWRTSLDLFPQEMPSDQSSRTWPKAGGVRNGCVYARPTWAPAIDGRGGSVSQWMTPNVPNGGRSVSAETVEAKGMTEDGKRQVGLESQAKHWGTPSAHERTFDPREVDHGVQLANQAAHWPTLFGFQAGTGPDGNEFSTAVRRWPTPRACENMQTEAHVQAITDREPLANRATLTTASRALHASRQVQTTQDGQQSSESSPNLSRRTRLNPNFVEWLMNWPIGWTAIDPTDYDSAETELSSTKQQQPSESCVRD